MSLETRLKSALERKKTNIVMEEELNKIKIIECGEPLLDIQNIVPNCEIMMRPQRLEYTGENILYAREKACKMLKEVSENLPYGYRIVIFDAFRPIEYQAMRFNKVLKDIMEKNSALTEEEARKEAFIYVFPPSLDPQRPPAHSTGGAIDLTFKDELGRLLDVGCKYGEFDNPAMYTNEVDTLSNEQKHNRMFLLQSMLKADFVNYPGEWWHFSYGDREWAAYDIKPHAIYGRAQLPMIKQ